MINNNIKSSERGSAILWILIAVGLFAALNYAFTNSTRTSTSLLTDTQAESYANQIIAYGNEVKSAIKRMQLRGCSDTEISFENAVVSGYSNPNSPSNKSCHVFDIAGGGLSWKNPPVPFYDTTETWFSGKYFFYTGTVWAGNGTTCSNDSCVDLIMELHVDDSFCEVFNKKFNINNPIEETTWEGTQWTGTHSYFSIFADEPNSVAANGKQAICSNPDSNTVSGILFLLDTR